MADELERIRQAWKQQHTPVIVRINEKKKRHRLRLPYSTDNRQWLQDGRRTNPEWIKSEKYWEIPKTWFNDFVNRALNRFGKLYIIQPYREQEKCARACMEAIGHECQCSCMGANHGAGIDNSWFEVSEAFATRWGNEEWACRLMLRKTS